MSEKQLELFSANPTWFHVFKAMIDSGDAAAMGGTVFLVYCVVKRHCAFGNGLAFPSIELIAEKSGVGTRQVIRSLEKLEELGYVTKHKEWRSNKYTLREKIPMTDNESGEVAAIASWPYIPDAVGAAVTELKNVQVSGDFGAAKIIKIERLTVNVQVISGEHATGVQINDAAAAEKLPDDLRESLRLRYEHAKAKKEGSS